MTDRAAMNREVHLIRVLCLVFFLSGFAALLYQVAWQRLLTVIYGVGSISITLIVSVYMLGLGFGALGGGLLAERIQARIRLYAGIELGIAAFGLVSLPFLAALAQHTAGSSHHVALAYIALFLFIPTLLMGMTLPLVTKIFSRSESFVSSVSLLYFVNTIGAAFGALIGAYLIISFFGLDSAVFAAVVINAALAVLIFRIRGSRAEQPAPQVVADAGGGELGSLAYPVVFATGFLAVGYEIVWFRLNEVLTKNSPYSFSSVLFVYLVGIAFGSYALMRHWQRLEAIDKRNLFFGLHFGIGAYVAISVCSYFYLTTNTALGYFTHLSFQTLPHPYLPFVIAPEFTSARDVARSLFASIDIFLWPAFFMLIPTLLMGAAFPLVSQLAYTREKGAGATIGTVYFFNVLGNVLGGAITGFSLLSLLGTERTLLAFASVGLLLGVFASKGRGGSRSLALRAALLGVLLVGLWLVFPGRGELYRAMHPSPGEGYDVHLEEGVDSLAVSFHSGANVRHYISGVPHGSRPLVESYFEVSEVAAAVEQPREALVIGFGTGVYTEAALKIPELETLTLVELSGSAMANLRKIQFIDDIVTDARLELVIDDGRRVLQRDPRKYDLIIMDPMHPQSAYSNNIYSLEFFELLRSRLAEGGALLTFNGFDGVLTKTVLSVFSHVRVYRYFCIASESELSDNDAHRRGVLAGLSASDLVKIRELEGSYLGDREALLARLSGYPINRDWKPVAEYFLGVGFHGGRRMEWRPKPAMLPKAIPMEPPEMTGKGEGPAD